MKYLETTSPDSDDEPTFFWAPRLSVVAAVFALLLSGLALVRAIESELLPATQAERLWAAYSKESLHDAVLDDSTLITLRRTACLGGCPAYSLTLHGSGKVEYVGTNYVCEFGARTAHADPREVKRLVDAIIAMGYVGHSWEPGIPWTDAPTVTSSIRHAGSSFEIVHYHGDPGAPSWLSKMEDEIDRVAGAQQWLPVPNVDGSRNQCRTLDGMASEATDEPAP